MKKIKFLLVFLPLLLGVIIYLLYRSKNLYYYNFIHFLNINGYVLFAREAATLYRKLFPTWVIYSLPDGLWLFSTGAVFLIARKKYLLHFFWFLFIYLFVVGGEFVQKYYGGHGTPIGTYDKTDIIAFTYAYISINIIALILRKFDNKYKYKDKTSKEVMQNIKYTLIFSVLGLLPNMF